MKLIIDIPKKQYEYLAKIANVGEEPLGYFERVIMLGTPLDEIKAKIETDLSWEMFDEYGNETALHKELMEILDNIGKGDKE